MSVFGLVYWSIVFFWSCLFWCCYSHTPRLNRYLAALVINENWFWGRCVIEMRSVLHIMRWCKILVVIWSSSDVHSYPTKCCDALALTATDSGSGREEEKQTIQIFSISAFSSNSPTISFSGSSYFQKEKSDHGFSRLPDNFRIPLLKNLKPPSTQL